MAATINSIVNIEFVNGANAFSMTLRGQAQYTAAEAVAEAAAALGTSFGDTNYKVNGAPVDGSYILKEGDRLEVYKRAGDKG
jgi:sulfur carrier protein ThiS